MAYRRYFLCFILLILVCTLWGTIFYFNFFKIRIKDFSTMYSACQALISGNNPYQTLVAHYLSTPSKLFINLNPPSLLWVISPLSRMPYLIALITWSIASLILGVWGAYLTFKKVFTAHFMQEYGVVACLVFLLCTSVWLNVSLGQVGLLIFFMVMVGYYYYDKSQDLKAGVIWGAAVAFKFFPGLLILFALLQKRYRVASITFLSSFVMLLTPVIIYGKAIYSRYLWLMLHYVHVMYSNNWNGSLYGFIFRLLVDPKPVQPEIIEIALVKYFSFACVCIGLIWFVKKIKLMRQFPIRHQDFALTLAMMLLLSPLGWIYYFPLLTLPYALTWNAVQTDSLGRKLIWLLSFGLSNAYVSYAFIKGALNNVTFASLYFYGLLLLIFLIKTMKQSPPLITNTVTQRFLYWRYWTPIMNICFYIILLKSVKEIIWVYAKYLQWF